MQALIVEAEREADELARTRAAQEYGTRAATILVDLSAYWTLETGTPARPGVPTPITLRLKTCAELTDGQRDALDIPAFADGDRGGAVVALTFKDPDEVSAALARLGNQGRGKGFGAVQDDA